MNKFCKKLTFSTILLQAYEFDRIKIYFIYIKLVNLQYFE